MQRVNITLNKCYVGEVGTDRSPSSGSQACTGWDTCPALLALVVLLNPTRVYQSLWTSEKKVDNREYVVDKINGTKKTEINGR